MAQEAVNFPGERLAGLWADLAHKIQKGTITLDELALFAQRRNPYGKGLLTQKVSFLERAGNQFLRPLMEVTVPAQNEPFNSASFFVERPGLFVNKDLYGRVRPRIVQSVAAQTYICAAARKECTAGKIFYSMNPAPFSELEHIARLLEAQWDYEPGVLPTATSKSPSSGHTLSGSMLLFLRGIEDTPRAVYIHRVHDNRKWCVNDWDLDHKVHIGRVEGTRILYPKRS